MSEQDKSTRNQGYWLPAGAPQSSEPPKPPRPPLPPLAPGVHRTPDRHRPAQLPPPAGPDQDISNPTVSKPYRAPGVNR